MSRADVLILLLRCSAGHKIIKSRLRLSGMTPHVRVGIAEIFRAAAIGVFQGYVLIDLCFDVESLRGKFSSSRPFYMGRDEHPKFPDRLLILQLPMLLALMSTIYVSVRDRCWQNIAALVLLLGSLFAGSQVLKLRETMASQRDSDSIVHAALVEIAWVHVAMFGMLSVCLMLLCAAGVRSEKQKGG